MAALALAGCGRKGGLDPPPSAAASPQQPAQQQGVGLSPLTAEQPSEPASQKSVLGERAGIGSGGAAIAPVGKKRHIPLDVLID
jgi:predicted small lipoprotein YifL